MYYAGKIYSDLPAYWKLCILGKTIKVSKSYLCFSVDLFYGLMKKKHLQNIILVSGGDISEKPSSTKDDWDVRFGWKSDEV